jgi:tRNA(Ile)-lysidine synthase TilS/MesJ
MIAGRKSSTTYDAILGVSGGVDSSYVALLAHRLGLKLLLVHCDNGWNSKEAVKNIYNIVKITGYDLETVVLDWDEFRDLQRAFIFAGVVDIEMITDHANRAAMFKIAKSNKIKNVLSGNNFTTEHTMPQAWVWNKRDAMNIKSIHKKFGTTKLKHYPFLNTIKLALYAQLGFGFNYQEPLLNINYIKQEVMDELKQELNWEDYGGKHYESEFTKFYQTYILPKKFNIDKRRAHLSDLVHSGQLTLEEAKKELQKPLYNQKLIVQQKDYVLKKLKISNDDFDNLMSKNPVPHYNYGSDRKIVNPLRKIKKIVNKIL